jgi:hypothetical protein
MPKASRKLDPADLVHRFAREMRRLRLRVRQAPAEPGGDEATSRHDILGAEADQLSQQVEQPGQKRVEVIRASKAGTHDTRPRALGHQITVALIPAAQAGLRQLQERTNMSKTDLANRAITTYEFLDAQLRAGHELIIQDNRTGETRHVHLF